MMNKPLNELSDDEIRAQIEELRKIQVPRQEPRKPSRVEKKQPDPNKKQSWRDQLFD